MKRLYIILVICISIVAAAIAAVIFLPKLNNKVDTAEKISADADFPDPDELMMTLNGEEMDWQTYSGWLKYSKIVYESSFGAIEDWTAESESSEDSANYDAIKDYTLSIIRIYKALEGYAEENGIELSEEDRAAIRTAWDAGVEKYGGEEELINFVNKYYGSREMYDYFAGISVLYSMCFEHAYGENGCNLPDADAIEYAETNGYLEVKHILFATTTEAGAAMSNAECSKVRDRAQAVLDQIKAYTGDDIESYFDSLVAEYSEDPGGADGYLFTDGQMVAEFETAAKGLEEYGVSELIRSDYGYHIILRLPIDPDKVPLDALQYGSNATMRSVAADSIFYAALESRAQQLNVQTTEAYDKLNVAEVFAGNQ